MNDLWLTYGKLVTPRGIIDGAVRIAGGKIASIRPRAPRSARTISVRGAYVAPGFIDLHVWGEPAMVSREAARGGTTAFLAALGPEPPQRLLVDVGTRSRAGALDGAACLGLHLEGPFLNPARGGALPKRWMRRPMVGELQRAARAAQGRVKLLTLAPELPGAVAAIRWCRRHGIIASLGHSDADGAAAVRAVDAGARAVTHIFNGMRPLHHRHPSLLDVALTEPRLVAMVILDGVHVSPAAFRLLLKAKGPERVALVTDSIRHQGWDAVEHHGAYYTRTGTLAGSRLAMIDAVRNAVRVGGVSVAEAARMASDVPARLLSDRTRGRLMAGKRADLTVFDQRFQVRITMVGGQVVYEH